jgi:hypothetical protein
MKAVSYIIHKVARAQKQQEASDTSSDADGSESRNALPNTTGKQSTERQIDADEQTDVDTETVSDGQHRDACVWGKV